MPKFMNEAQVYSRNCAFLYRASYSGDNPEYEGWAINLDASEDDLKWQITKHTYDSSGHLVQSDWANNSDAFSFSWTLRATYF